MTGVRHLHFTQSLEPLQGGGLGTSAIALHRKFLGAGLASKLCATYGDAPQFQGEQVEEFARIKPGYLYYSRALARRSRDLVAGVDVVHGHGLYVGTNFLLGREARRQGRSLVYHAHGFFEPWILRRSRGKKWLVHWLFENANFRQVKLWRALTLKEADQIRAQGIKAPIVVAPNGLDMDEFPEPANRQSPIATPRIPALTKQRARMLFLGRIHPKKGLDLLLSAWAQARRPGWDWELVIAGPDEGGHEAEIRSLASTLGLADDVHFTGPVQGATKNALLHSADLFALTSYSEGFSMALLEAMACGIPVAATNSCNFPEISSAAAGWECEATLDAVSAMLRQALGTSDEERRQRGSNGRNLVASRYSWSRVVSTLVAACDAHC